MSLNSGPSSAKLTTTVPSSSLAPPRSKVTGPVEPAETTEILGTVPTLPSSTKRTVCCPGGTSASKKIPVFVGFETMPNSGMLTSTDVRSTLEPDTDP